MILTSLEVNPADFEQRTGWAIKAEGACKGEVCVPLPSTILNINSQIDVRLLAERLRMPLIHDQANNLWCLGPQAGGRALTTTYAPDFVLPDIEGKQFSLHSLRGRKVLLVAWASW